MNDPIDHDRRAARHQILRQIGASEDEATSLLAYNENIFRHPNDELTLPLPDEPFVPAWQQYSRIVHESGTLRSLEPFLVQLQFPIVQEISRSASYLQATQQGSSPELNKSWVGLPLTFPKECEVEVYASFAGSIATITAAHRDDFVLLVQALAKRNEPVPLPPTMGALMIAGYRNWHRIHEIQQENDAFRAAQVLRDPSSFQDRFILLSRSNYSGVTAEQIGLSTQEWCEISWLIRREHEVAHYFCKRVLGSMRNLLLDEIIADYCGIVRAFGSFRADWLLLFLGLEAYPTYREGSRFENYRGIPPMSDRQLTLLQQLVYQAVVLIEEFDREIRNSEDDADGWPCAALAIASMCLEEFMESDALARLHRAHCRARSQIRYSTSKEGALL